ncbi:MAG: protein kinase domain-containing protein [Planctomycetota bacterium]|jgi:serine/threonine protein kinase
MADQTGAERSRCLTEDILRQFLAGELDHDQDAMVSDHLEKCSACQRSITTLLSVDDMCLPWIKESARDTMILARECSDTVALNRLKQIGYADADSPVETFDVPDDVSTASNAFPQRIDRYEIVTEIGRGGMGTVYLGLDRDDGCECAIKLLSASRRSDAKAVKRSHREMHAISRLSHPNIVSVLNAGEIEDGRTFLAMEFLRGSDLHRHVLSHGPLSAIEACQAVIQAARGLQHAHERGFVHRDVKPSNLFQTESGDVKVLDFGLVHLKHSSLAKREALTDTGFVLGTADFLSPEQAADPRSADPRSDIYSLGCTLAWLLSRKQVYPGNSVTKVLFAHRDNPVPELEALQPRVPHGLNAVFQKMIAKEPEDRFQSMADVAAALAPFTLMEHETPVAEMSPSSETQHLPPSVVESVPNRRMSTVAGVLITLILLATGITIVIRAQDETTAQSGNKASSDSVTPVAGPEVQLQITAFEATTNGNLNSHDGDSDPSVTANDATTARTTVTSDTTTSEPAIPEIDWTQSAVVDASPAHTLNVAEVPEDVFNEDGNVCDLDLSADGTELLVAAGHHVQWWDLADPFAATLKRQRTICSSAWVRAVEQIPGSNSILAVNSDHSAVLHSIDDDSFREFDTGRGSAFTSLVFSNDGKRAWAGMYHAQGGRIVEWNLNSGHINRSLVVETRTAGSACLRLRRSADGRFLAAGGCLEGGVALIETDSLTVRHRLPTQGPIRSLAFSPVHHVVVTSAEDDAVRAWDVETGKELWRLSGKKPCGAMQFSRDGQFLFLSEYHQPRMLTLNVKTRNFVSSVQMPWYCDSLAVDPQGRFIVAANGYLSGKGNGRILLWKLDSLIDAQVPEIETLAATR